jgi:hypothetical protein
MRRMIVTGMRISLASRLTLVRFAAATSERNSGSINPRLGGREPMLPGKTTDDHNDQRGD